MVADLKAGTWRVTAPDGTTSTLVVPEDSGLGEWRGKAGSYRLVYERAVGRI